MKPIDSKQIAKKWIYALEKLDININEMEWIPEDTFDYDDKSTETKILLEDNSNTNKIKITLLAGLEPAIIPNG